MGTASGSTFTTTSHQGSKGVRVFSRNLFGILIFLFQVGRFFFY